MADLHKELGASCHQTLSFNFKNAQDWTDYQKLCNEVYEYAGKDMISILVNNVEEFDTGKGKLQKTSDDQLR